MDFFALDASREFGRKVATALGAELAAHEEREFEDGEHKARPLVSVRGHDVYVIQSLHSGPVASVNDKLCRLLFFISTLKENGPERIGATRGPRDLVMVSIHWGTPDGRHRYYLGTMSPQF